MALNVESTPGAFGPDEATLEKMAEAFSRMPRGADGGPAMRRTQASIPGGPTPLQLCAHARELARQRPDLQPFTGRLDQAIEKARKENKGVMPAELDEARLKDALESLLQQHERRLDTLANAVEALASANEILARGLEVTAKRVAQLEATMTPPPAYPEPPPSDVAAPRAVDANLPHLREV